MSVHGLCRALAARGHDVQVFTTSVDGPVDSPVPLATPVDLDGVKVWYFPSRCFRRLYWSPPMTRALVRHIGEFDVVHLHGLFVWPAWAAARAARRAGVPYVVAPRGMLEKSLIRRKNRAMKSLLMAAFGRRMLEGAAGLHMTSPRESAQAAAFGFALPPVYEVPNGVDLIPTPVAPEGISPAVVALINGPPFLLFIGRISWKKGLDRLIAALPQVPGIRLVMAGNDEEGYLPTLKSQAAALGMSDRIEYCGPVRVAEKAALLSHAMVLVLPSYSENFGNVVLEAMVAGCPVVVTPEVGLADLVRTSGAGWVIDGAPAPLGAGLANLVADSQLRETMGARGRSAARAYAWSAIAERMDCAYQDIVA